MQYLCNICKKTITTGEFKYSMDLYKKPLCREHQKLFGLTENINANPPKINDSANLNDKKESITLNELNKKQRDSVLCEDKRILVLAGAGSGKTKTLIQKVLYLIAEKNIDPRHILAITFTKNAANEMLDRLILAADTDKSYQKILSDKKLSTTEKNQERNILKNILGFQIFLLKHFMDSVIKY